MVQNLEPDTPVTILKEKIAAARGDPTLAGLMRLVYAEQVLESGKLLRDYHVQPEATVHMALNVTLRIQVFRREATGQCTYLRGELVPL